MAEGWDHDRGGVFSGRAERERARYKRSARAMRSSFLRTHGTRSWLNRCSARRSLSTRRSFTRRLVDEGGRAALCARGYVFRITNSATVSGRQRVGPQIFACDVAVSFTHHKPLMMHNPIDIVAAGPSAHIGPIAGEQSLLLRAALCARRYVF